MEIITDGLALYYDAYNNVNSGEHDSTATSWIDLSGNGFNGTINNGVWAEDGGLYFNGSNTWVNCSRHNYPSITLEALVSFSSYTNNEDNLIANWQSGGYSLCHYQGKLAGTVYRGGYKYVYGSAAKTNEKILVSMTFDGTDLKLYENGYLVSTLTIGGAYTNPSSNTVTALGTNPNGSSSGTGFFNGTFYSARIYSKALTEEEILNNYKYDYLRYLDGKYILLSSNNVYYNILNNNLNLLDITSLTTQNFKNYGVTPFDFPIVFDNNLSLENLKVHIYQDSIMSDSINLKLIAVKDKQTIISDAIDLTDSSITGIDSVVFTGEGELIMSVSFDDKASWKIWDTTNETWTDAADKYSGMNKETVEAITKEQWDLLYIGADKFYIKAVLQDTTQTIEQIKVQFVN